MNEVGLFNILARIIAGMLIIFNLLVSLEAVTVDPSRYWVVNGIGIMAIGATFILFRARSKKGPSKRSKP